jgi:glutaredoxin 3
LYCLLQSASHLNSWLGKLFASEEINLALVIYTKPGCPYCEQARVYYNENGIAFTDYDAQNDRARRKEMLSYSGGDPTVPCIVEDGKYQGSGWGDPPRG